MFIRSFRQGELLDGTPMPWGAYGVYRYLRSLPPVAHDTGPKVQRNG